jgi:hypothetical protein
MNRNIGTLPFIILALGIAAAGYLAGNGYYRAHTLDRTVIVKGLAEREVEADQAIWPIRFVSAGNDLEALYRTLENQTAEVRQFLSDQGFNDEEVSVGPPAIVDKQAQAYGDANVKFRFSATQTITVYTMAVDRIRDSQREMNVLGKAGIVISGDDYQGRTQYLFTRLNDVKPEMIEEATRNAREVADKFAKDSQSVLGKIKSASQGQFSITDRDSNTPHIKKVRVVSTIEYFLSD